MFGNLGLPELIFIFVLALLIFGPKKLPEIGKTIGRGMAEFRRASSDLRRSLETELEEADRKAALPPASTTPPATPPASTEPQRDNLH